MRLNLFGLLGNLFFSNLCMFADDGDLGGGGSGEGGSGEEGGGEGAAGGQGGEGGSGEGGEAGLAIPDQYKEKGWAKKLEGKSQDDLYKQIDNLDSLNGKLASKQNVAFDYETASEEEIQTHLARFRPEKIEDYTFGKEGDNKDVLDGMKSVAHRIGLDQYQANEMSEAFREYEEDKKAEAFDPESYNEMLKKDFGDDYKVVAGKASNELVQHLSPEDKEFFDKNFPNQHAAWVLRLVNKMKTAYGVTEGHLPTGGEGGGGGGNSVEKIEARQKEIRQELTALSKRQHTDKEKKDLVSELTDLTSKKMALSK